MPQLDITLDSVVVVDNDSGDSSIEMLSAFIEQQEMSESVELIASTKNGGFSYGNNLAIRNALENTKEPPEFILLLNPDTLMLDGGVFELLSFMSKHQKAGIAGSQLESEDGYIQCSFFRFHSILSELESSMKLGFLSKALSSWRVSNKPVKQAVVTDWVAGASMLIRTKVFMDIGLMDEGYFLYFEETDFCLQAKRSGWDCWYVPNSRVVHYVGQSTGVVSGDDNRARRPKYWFEARQRYFIKNHGILYTMLADFIWGGGFAIWRIRRLLQNKSDRDPEKMLIDFWKYSVFFSWLTKRFN
jgi:GT2 family glycosyltransferase